MRFIEYSYMIPLFALIGAAVNGFVSFSGMKVSRRFVYFVSCSAIFMSFLLSVGCFFELSRLEPTSRIISVSWFEWIALDPLKINAAFLIDPLSCVMMIVVTGVGFLIHLYSTGYMDHDPSYARFFSYLNLFCFAMLVLVMADNLLLMFVGWEGVGLCSYLLIGFWYEHKPNAEAGMKAFIVNRIGDFAFIIGVIVLFWAMYSVGHPTLAFSELKTNAALLEGIKFAGFPVVTVVCLLFFFGATGKSAQIPLYVWLPDAMAGPTPVSALIHAATMVTAGIYMIGRTNFLFTMSPVALTVVACVGALTAFFAATIGFAQNDIKKILAYSTVSQLGYMFLGMGTGVYATGIFHLFTHAFFKACLFLGAGCVILSMHHEQNITRMGGLKKFIPAIYLSFLVATLALAGIFPLSGFFSKDEILWQAFSRGGHAHLYYALWGLGLAGAFATAFYMFRCISLVFWGDMRRKHDYEHHEADALEKKRHLDPNYQPFTVVEHASIMTYVVMALAVLSVVVGLLGCPNVIGKFIGLPNFFEEWLVPVFSNGVEPSSHGEAVKLHSSTLEYTLMFISVTVALMGIFIAKYLYTKRQNIVNGFTTRFNSLYKLVLNKYYVDEIYAAVFVKPLLAFNNALKWFDGAIIDWFVNATGIFGILWARLSGWCDSFFVDGTVNAVALATIASGRKIKRIQTGRVQHYFYIALLGIIAALIWSLLP